MSYHKKLSDLLDDCTFFKDNSNGYYTPRHFFETTFQQICENPLKFFDSIEKEFGVTEKLDRISIYNKAGGGESGAYAVVEDSIYTLQNYTLDLKKRKKDEEK